MTSPMPGGPVKWLLKGDITNNDIIKQFINTKLHSIDK